MSLFFTFCAKTNHPQNSPQDLRCEYQTNPLGLDVLQPRFSWIVSDARRGATQSAYQIIVSSRQKLLEENKGDMWDSGQIKSDQSVHVVYNGSPLASRERYYWKVRTWDKEGNTSPFSEIAWLEMGLLQQDEWHASWIGKKPEKKERENEKWPWGCWIWYPEERGVDKPVFFRKSFTIDSRKKITKALMRTTADNKFTAYLNGSKVGSGTEWIKVYDFDAKTFLTTGKNSIAVKAVNTAGTVCGFIFSLKIEFSDGTSQVINSDKEWITNNAEKPGWTKSGFSDKNWKKVQIIEQYGGDQWGKIDPNEIFEAPRSVFVRKEFKAGKNLKRARVYVTGLGSYNMHINGQRIGKDIFTPGWTFYPDRLQYQTYDVTAIVKAGDNCVGAILGNVWWSGGLGSTGQIVYSEGPLRFLMQLVLDYEDGTSEKVVTDKSWQTHNSPIIYNTIYHGEIYDATKEVGGWDKPGLKKTDWETVIVFDKDNAKLVAQQGPTIQVTEELEPVNISSPEPGKYVFDLGQNMAGCVRLKVKGSSGNKVVLKFAETLKKDGNIYTENLRKAKATDMYILKGEGTEIWEPLFTYHGFRYVEVTGYPGKPTKDAITGRVFHSAAPLIGHFACSNELLNYVQKNINWGLRGNMHSVPTDCPQRDERLGWMGDAQIIAPTASYNRNMARFFSKWMHDISDCQLENGGVYDVNPRLMFKGPASPGWGDAVVVIPWVVYQFYGDKRIIEDNYATMAGWVGYMETESKADLYEVDGYGDWVAVVPSPKKPIGSAYFYYSTRLLAKMAAIIGRNDDAQKYESLAAKIGLAFNKKHLNKETFQYTGATQSANLLPLAFGITPEEVRENVMANIVQDVKHRDYHLSTGFIGTSYLLPMLSDYGYHDVAYRVATQETYPSWGHMVKQNATTIWELWNSDTEGPGMNSRNHFALGSVGAWYFAYLAGIRPDPQYPGFKKAVIAPKPVGDLTWAEARLKTLYGELSSRWDKTR